MTDLRTAGERLSKLELEKRQAISCEDYDRAKQKKAQLDQYRNTVYRFLEVDDLLEVNGVRLSILQFFLHHNNLFIFTNLFQQLE